MSNVKFLPKVIGYDRYQPEFYEDTLTYIKKRTSKNKIKKCLDLYKNNKNIINSIEKKVKKIKLIAEKLELNKSGYRLITNCGKNANQEVFHFHMHMLGGENLGPLLSKKKQAILSK